METEKLIDEEFSRNIGILAREDQKRLLSSRVAVAGAGGVGGLHLLTLARLGIGKFIIADPDIFEPVNINRQYGALHSTMNRNKAEVLAEMVKDINPSAEVRVFSEGVSTENIESFLDGVDVFVDGIDFFEIEIRRLLFNRCRVKGIYALTAAPLGFGATLQTFAPDGMSFDDYFGVDDSMDYHEKIAAFAAGLAPNPWHIHYMDLSKVSFIKKTGPAVSPACTLASSLIATETVKILTGKGEVRPVPCYLQFDMMRGKFRKGKVIMGGKNPIQRLKKAIILKKVLAAASSGGTP
ncbi:ThiF family adenylyltransferase [Geobacter sp.]|uniref:ThiF family adenylyltransferase n=1 Tax=Geobacter sp. TaxID=46610 RepID=UPI001AC7FB12|nr:ThiF family adenylyltransferase [Geobacter sp.]CAG0944344.1 putative adenylyltransferase/sulfurtransferase MoeZ [Anaerolineae bacterium]